MLGIKVGVRFFASDMIRRLHRCGNQGGTIENTCFLASGQMGALNLRTYSTSW